MARLNKKDRGIFERPKGSGIWYIRYHDAEGVEHRESVGAKGLARRIYDKRKAQIRAGVFEPKKPPAPVVTIAQVLDAYKAYEDKHDKHCMDTPKGHERLKARFGTMPAESITRVNVEDFAADLRAGLLTQVAGKPLKPLAASTVNHHITLLGAAMRRAFRAGTIKVNPLTDLSRLKENNKRDRWLSDPEETRLMEALPPRVHPLVLTAIHAGLRKGELHALRNRNINLASRVLRVEEAKGGEGRSIPMNEILVEALTTIKGDAPNEFLFRSSKGNALANLRKVWDEALREAKIDNFVFHDLRHTFGSRLVMSGVDLKTVQILMGHKSIKMTERYAHLAPGHLRAAVAKLAVRDGQKPWAEGAGG
jgi:integrase